MPVDWNKLVPGDKLRCVDSGRDFRGCFVNDGTYEVFNHEGNLTLRCDCALRYGNPAYGISIWDLARRDSLDFVCVETEGPW
jgi:hypothetical protein